MKPRSYKILRAAAAARVAQACGHQLRSLQYKLQAEKAKLQAEKLATEAKAKAGELSEKLSAEAAEVAEVRRRAGQRAGQSGVNGPVAPFSFGPGLTPRLRCTPPPSTARERLQTTRTRALEAKKRATAAFEELREDLSRDAEGSSDGDERASFTDDNLAKHSISPELRVLAKSLTVKTFLDFPLAELQTESRRSWRLSPWQETHALLITKLEPSLDHCRYELCPKHIPESRFWKIYFTLAGPLLENRGRVDGPAVASAGAGAGAGTSADKPPLHPSRVLPPSGGASVAVAAEGAAPMAAMAPAGLPQPLEVPGSHRRGDSEVSSQMSFQMVGRASASVHSISTNPASDISPTSNSDDSKAEEVTDGGLRRDTELEELMNVLAESPGASAEGGAAGEDSAGDDDGSDGGSEIDLSTFKDLGIDVSGSGSEEDQEDSGAEGA